MQRFVSTALTFIGLTMLLTACGDDSDPTPTTSSAAAGPCDRLVGDGGLVEQALAVTEPQDGSGIQGELFDIVANGPAELQDPVGQLVDFLDDPQTYLTDGQPDETVTSAVAEIEAACS